MKQPASFSHALIQQQMSYVESTHTTPWRTRSRGWRCGFFAALLSLMSWLVPTGTLFSTAATPARASAWASPGDLTPAEQAQIAAEFALWINATIASSDFDASPSAHSSVDLTGDGVVDHILVDPGNFFAPDGRIMVVDSATNESRYELTSPHNELCFGEYVGLFPDCNFDGLGELVVASGAPRGEDTQLALRVFSGSDGELLGIVTHTYVDGIHASTVRAAGDANADRTIDGMDVCHAIDTLGEPAIAAPLDLNVDGETSVIDVLRIAGKAQLELDSPTAAAVCANICAVDSTGDGFVALTGSAVAATGWKGGILCWAKSASLAAKVVALLAGAFGCGTATMAPPAALACIVAWCCLWADFLSSLMLWTADCWEPSPLSEDAHI